MNHQLMELIDFINAIPSALIIIDERQTIQVANYYTELLFAYSKDDLIGKPISALFAENEVFSKYYTQFLASLKTQTPKENYYELSGLKKDKTKFPMELGLGAWKNKTQDFFTLVNFRGLTRHTQLPHIKEELEQSNRSKDQFLATMNHQLRTPLNAILGFSEILLLKLAGNLSAEQEKQISIINKSGKHLLYLINDLSDLAKIDSGEISFFIEEININELVLDIVHASKPLIEAKQLSLNTQIPEQPLIARTDKRALTQIITNIVNNAIKFTEKGEISIKLKNQKNKLVLYITDTGVGIKAEKMERIFQAFQQLFIAEKKNEGSGLGLHISKKLANLIGVGLSVTSEYGKGTHFSIFIPKL